MLRSIGKQSGESVRKKRKTTMRRICRKKGFKPWNERVRKWCHWWMMRVVSRWSQWRKSPWHRLTSTLAMATRLLPTFGSRSVPTTQTADVTGLLSELVVPQQRQVGISDVVPDHAEQQQQQQQQQTGDRHYQAPHLIQPQSTAVADLLQSQSIPVSHQHVSQQVCVQLLRTLTTWHCPHSPTAAVRL